MLARRSFLRWSRVAVVAAIAALVLSTVDASTAAPPTGGGGLQSSFDLQKQLETGLKARRPVDFAYIRTIVTKVENGTLPRPLVDQAYLYARSQGSKYPLVQFQFSLVELKKRAGVK